MLELGRVGVPTYRNRVVIFPFFGGEGGGHRTFPVFLGGVQTISGEVKEFPNPNSTSTVLVFDTKMTLQTHPHKINDSFQELQMNFFFTTTEYKGSATTSKAKTMTLTLKTTSTTTTTTTTTEASRSVKLTFIDHA